MKRDHSPQEIHKYSTIPPGEFYAGLASLFIGEHLQECVDCGRPVHNKRCYDCNQRFCNRLHRDRKAARGG